MFDENDSPALPPQDVLDSLTRQVQPDLASNASVDPQSTLDRLTRKVMGPRAQPAPPPQEDLSAYGTPAPAPEPDFDPAQFGVPATAEKPPATPPGDLPAGSTVLGRFGKGAAQAVASGVGGILSGLGEVTSGRQTFDKFYSDYAGFDKMDLGGRQKVLARIDSDVTDPVWNQQLHEAFNARADGAAAKSRDEFTTPSITKTGEAITQYGEQKFPLTPAEKESISARAGGVVGGAAPYVAASALGAPSAVILGAAAIQMGLGGASSAGKEAREAGADPATQREAAAINGAAQAALGAVPLGVFMREVQQSAPGLTPWVIGKLWQAGQSGLTFAGIGEVQEYVSRKIAQELYDPKAGYSPDAKRLLGSLVGGALVGPFHGLKPPDAGAAPPGAPPAGGPAGPAEPVTPGAPSGPDRPGAPPRSGDPLWDEAQGGEPPPSAPSDTQAATASGTPPEPLPGQPGGSPAAPPPGSSKEIMDTYRRQLADYDQEQERRKNEAVRNRPVDDANKTFEAFKQSPLFAHQSRVLADHGVPIEVVALAATRGPEQWAALMKQATADGAYQPPAPKDGGQPAAEAEAAREGTRNAPVAVKSADDVARAEQVVNTNPTPAQAAAENYQSGHIEIDRFGLTGKNGVTIENPKDSTRNGPIDTATGKPAWSSVMAATYGRVKGTVGADKQHLDLFVGPEPDGDHPAFVLDQRDPKTGKFDETKSFVGFPDQIEAVKAYLASYGKDGYARIQDITPMEPDQFKDWFKNADHSKPAADYTPKALSEPAEGLSPEAKAPATLPAPDVIGPEAAHENHTAVEQALVDAGENPDIVRPADLARAAELHADGVPADAAFPAAVIMSLIEDGHITHAQVREALKDAPHAAEDILDTSRPSRNVVPAEAPGAATGGEAVAAAEGEPRDGGAHGGENRSPAGQAPQDHDAEAGEPDTGRRNDAGGEGVPVGPGRGAEAGTAAGGAAAGGEPAARAGEDAAAGREAAPANEHRTARPAANRPINNEPTSLLPFVASEGGLKPTPDLRAIGFDHKSRALTSKGPRPILRGTGMDYDQLVEKMRENGFLPPDDMTHPGDSGLHRKVLDMLDAEHRGSLTRPHHDEGRKARHERERIEDQNAEREAELADHHKVLVSALEDAGLMPGALPQDMRRATELMADRGFDPIQAFDEAIQHGIANDELLTGPEADNLGVKDDLDDLVRSYEESGGEAAAEERGGGAEGEEAPVPEEGRSAPGAGEAPGTERGADGKLQHVIPGAESISGAERAQRKADQGLKPKVAQKPPEGLFGDESKQTDLLDLARKPPAEPPKAETADVALTRALAVRLEANQPINHRVLQDEATKAYGGTLAEGKFDRKDAHDALELAVNLLIKKDPDLRVADNGGWKLPVRNLEKLLSKLPTQRVRSEEQVSFQQFSTPPHYALAVAYAAGLRKGDTVLEPSAGTGSIVAAATHPGVKIIANELSPRRADILRALVGDDGKVFTENAEQIDNILPKDVKPTVVVMNPPFSQTAGRMGDKRVIETGAVHIEQALNRLEPGGRLVAIVGRGMSMEAPRFKNWWNDISKDNSVRANIGVAGDVYGKYGTNFGTRLLVIDKTPPISGQSPVLAEVHSVGDLMRALEPIRDSRSQAAGTSAELKPIEPGRVEVAAGGQGISTTARPQSPEPGGVGAGEPGDRGVAGPGPGRAGEPSPPDVRVEAGQRPVVAPVEPERTGEAGAGSEPAPGPAAGDELQAGRGEPAGRDLQPAGEPSPGLAAERLAVEHAAPGKQTAAEITENLYESYEPKRVRMKGAKKHPGPLVESAAMSSVDPPPATYQPALPQKVIDDGRLSLPQLEAVIYAGQAHSKFLPAAEGATKVRKGYFIGDGCVAAGTRIYDPIARKHTAIEDLLGRSHFVLALTPVGFRPALATMTFLKGEAALYRVVLDDGRKITVTGQHRFLTPLGWSKIDDGLTVGDWLARADTDPATAPSTHAAYAPHGWQRPEDCLDRCFSGSRPCDGPPQSAADIGRECAPSRGDARAHTPLCLHADGPAPSIGGIPRALASGRPSKNSYAPWGSRDRALSAIVGAAASARSSAMRHQVGVQFPAGRTSHPQLDDGAQRDSLALASDLSPNANAVCSQAYEEDTRSSVASPQTEPPIPRSKRRADRPGQPLYVPQPGRSCASSAWGQIASLEFVGRDKFYDMYVPGPENYVAEGFVNHNTGVGKGAEIAGIILDNWQQGRKKAVWVSEKRKLMNDAKRDWSWLDQNDKQIFNLGNVGTGKPVEVKQGIGFITYDTLKGGMSDQEAIARGDFIRKQLVSVNGQGGTVVRSFVRKGADGRPEPVVTVKLDNGTEVTVPHGEVAQVGKKNAVKTRIDQIVDWFGKDFDGVVAFDESHNMGNAVTTKGDRGDKDAARKALAGMELQKRLPNARIVYVSATGATEVSNLAYAERLGLWGRGTPFADRNKFISEVSSGGIAAMELIARDMKQLGVYTARNLSYDGVQYDRIEHKLDANQREIYDNLAEAWQVVLRNINEALKDTGAAKNGRAKSAAMSAFWGGHQRFFNQIITSLQMPSVIKAVEKDLREGRQVVLQLTNTNEAAQERAAAKAESAEDIEDLDITPRDMVIQLVEKSFPTQQYERYVDENGSEKSRPVVDSQGNPVQNKKAMAAREALIERLSSIRVPQGPLDMVLDHFGIDNVSEVTGRGRRFVLKEDERSGQKKRTEESRPGSSNQSEIDAFQGGKKKILVFSEAGGTGASYHADNRSESKGARRSHYLVQAGWRADKAVQGFGRTHRTNQASAPIFHLVQTNLDGQKRFISSIARRLAQLGALTKGQRQAGDQGVFSARDNLESPEAQQALQRFWTDLLTGQVEGVNVDDFERQTGLVLRERDKNGNVVGSKQDLPDITKFLNRLLSLKIGLQNKVFQEFSERLDDVIDQRRQAGLLDVGLETVRADKITKDSEQTVHTIEESGAQTKYVHLTLADKFKPVPLAAVENNAQRPVEFWAVSPTGKVHAVSDGPNHTDANSGKIIDQYRVVNPVTGSRLVHQDRVKGRDSKWVRIDQSQARERWQTEIDKAPEYVKRDLHLITGAILPIWDRLKGSPRVVRLNTDAGERLIGRVVPDSQIGATLQALGAEGKKVDPGTLLDRLMGGARAKLANGWTLKRSLVAGEHRIELIGPTSVSEGQQVKADGAFTERIDYTTRYFVPTEPEEGAKTLARLIEHRPVVELGSAGAAPVEDAAQMQAGPVVAPKFYSAVARVIDQSKMEKGTAAQWLGMLRNKSGVKPDEMRWLGLDRWLSEQGGSVTKQAVQDFVRSNEIEVKEVHKGGTPEDMDDWIFHNEVATPDGEGTVTWMTMPGDDPKGGTGIEVYHDDGGQINGFAAYAEGELIASTETFEQAVSAINERKGLPSGTRYGQYVLPGGESYRELLLTLPEKEGGERGPKGWGNTAGGTHDTANFRSSHWDEPNVLAHVRFDDRVIDGKKTLHVAEIQSDWGQLLRRQEIAKSKAIEANFLGITMEMEKAGVLKVECD